MEERMKILKMVEEGKISAREADRLIGALEGGELNNIAKKGKAKWLKVRVYDKDSERTRVKVNVPLALVKIGARIGARFSMKLPEETRLKMEGKGIDFSDIRDVEKLELLVDSLAEEGPFRLVDVEEDDEKVEVFIE